MSCKTCHKQYTWSSEEFRAKFNNYSCAYRYYRKNMKVKQESFYTHFENGVHSDESDREVRMIDQSDNTEDLRRRRHSFWESELDTF